MFQINNFFDALIDIFFLSNIMGGRHPFYKRSMHDWCLQPRLTHYFWLSVLNELFARSRFPHAFLVVISAVNFGCGFGGNPDQVRGYCIGYSIC